MSESKFPKLEKVTEDMQNLSVEEKLELIAKEGQTLYDYCLAQGFSSHEMKACLKPFHATRPKAQAVIQDSKYSTYGIAILVAVLAVTFYYPPAYNMVCVHGKLASMKLLPYWDWTYIYAEDCMIYNPYMTSLNMTKEECESCVEITEKGSVDIVTNATQDTMSEEFLWIDFPALVDDGMRDWPTDKTLTLDEISKLYASGKLDKINECLFNTTIPDIDTLGDFIKLHDSGKLPSGAWSLTWENCEMHAAKMFRQFYKRPYFFAPMAEASRHNQIFISKGIPEEPESVDVFNNRASASWVGVVSGVVRYDLGSVEGCRDFGCDAVSGEVMPGQILVVPQRIWGLGIGPASEELTIAVVTAVSWDEM